MSRKNYRYVPSAPVIAPPPYSQPPFEPHLLLLPSTKALRVCRNDRYVPLRRSRNYRYVPSAPVIAHTRRASRPASASISVVPVPLQ